MCALHLPDTLDRSQLFPLSLPILDIHLNPSEQLVPPSAPLYKGNMFINVPITDMFNITVPVSAHFNITDPVWFLEVFYVYVYCYKV